MNIGILTFDSTLYTVKRLIEEGRILGHNTYSINTWNCQSFARTNHAKMYNFPEDTDIVIPRVGTALTPYTVSLLRHMEDMGIKVLNNAMGVQNAKDKFLTMQLLSKAGISVPKTALIGGTKGLGRIINDLGGFPVVGKPLTGSQGNGIFLLKRKWQLWKNLNHIPFGKGIILQEYIKDSGGEDIRVFVIDGKVASAMVRKARDGDFRSNVHLGGEGKAIEIDSETEEMAIKSARVIGLTIAGIDIIKDNKNKYIIEVNASPGFQELEKATGKNIAMEIINHAVYMVNNAK